MYIVFIKIICIEIHLRFSFFASFSKTILYKKLFIVMIYLYTCLVISCVRPNGRIVKHILYVHGLISFCFRIEKKINFISNQWGGIKSVVSLHFVLNVKLHYDFIL